jgi:hypothetical protein
VQEMLHTTENPINFKAQAACVALDGKQEARWQPLLYSPGSSEPQGWT